MAQTVPTHPDSISSAALKEGVRHGAQYTAVDGLRAGLTGVASSPALLGALGLTAAVSAGLTEIEFQTEKRQLRRIYAEELAAQLGKPIHKIKDGDLARFAKGDKAKGIAGNKTIADAIGKARKKRNIGVILSVAASLAALVVVGLAAPPILAAIGLGSASTGMGAIAGKFLVEGAMGLMAYNAIKSPIHWAAEKMFGIDDKTTHDHIVEMIRDQQTGKNISQLQVMGAFVAAHDQLDEMIESKYGGKFEDLPLAVKQAVTRDLSGPLHLEQLTHAINQGKVNVTELAFAVEGNASGVLHSGDFDHAKPGMLHSMLASVGSAVGKVTNLATGHIKKDYPALGDELASDTSTLGRSFVERLGRAPADNSTSYAERVEQSRIETGLTQR